MWWLYYTRGVIRSFLFLSFFFLLSFFLFVLKIEIRFLVRWEVVSSGGATIDFCFLFDWVRVSFGCVVILISSSVLWFTCEYMRGDVFMSRFSWLVFLFVISMCFVIFIPNLVAILLGWDGLGLISFLLVIYYQNYKSLRAGIITILINRVGDVIILLRIGLFSYEGIWEILFFNCTDKRRIIFFFILVAGITKRAQIPFSSWLPAAIAAPTPVSALVHSSTLVTAGVFLLIRFYEYLRLFRLFQPILLLISTLTMLIAGIAANLETDLKKVIALSTLRQLGVMIAALGIGIWKLSLFHLYTHAMFKALLFLCAGAFIHRSQHSQDIRIVGMLWNQAPVIVSCLHISNLSLCGAPFLSGFYSKDIILEGSLFFDVNIIILFILFFATGLTVSYSVRLAYYSLWGSFNFYTRHNWGEEAVREIVPICFLMLGGVCGGSVFMWILFYGDGVFFLDTKIKLLTISVVSLGGTFGWFFSSLLSFVKVFHGFLSNKLLYGITNIWFIVNLSRQGVVKKRIGFGSFFLYQRDRGWIEFFGGEGVSSLRKSVISWFQYYGFNRVLVYMGTMVFIRLSFVLFLYSI